MTQGEVPGLAASSVKEDKTTLQWKRLTYSIQTKKVEKVILHSQDGEAAPGDLLAIMGPSGSGKTSLLNALAGRLPVTRMARCTGCIEVNGIAKQELPCPFADISAYVEQDDALFALSTVQETLAFSAHLRLPAATSAEERDRRIEGVLRQLGLLKSRYTNVGGGGGGEERGLSGGERKRLSIAIELLHKPKCIFLDEPTTGLDSYQALNVINKMDELAKDNHTIVMSIHQPRSAIFVMFSGIYLLAAGKPIYVGSTSEASDYFEKLGFPLPPKFNPTDFLLDLVSVDQRDEEQQALTEARLVKLQASWSSITPVDKVMHMRTMDRKQAILNARIELPAGQHAIAKPFILLLARAWRERTRDKFAVVLMIFFGVFMNVIFGSVYWQLGRGQQDIQNRSGFIFFLTMNQAFASCIDTSMTFPAQIFVVQRERASRMYAILPYYISNLMVKLPMDLVPVLVSHTVAFYMGNLGGRFLIFILMMLLESLCAVSIGMALSACFKSVTMAAQTAPIVVILNLIFSGFVINLESIPPYFIWLREVSFIRFAFTGCIVNEFKDESFECDGSDSGVPCIRDGDAVLTQLGFDGEDLLLKCIVALLIIALTFNILAFAILVYRRPCFLPLTTSKDEVDTRSSEDASKQQQQQLDEPFCQVTILPAKEHDAREEEVGKTTI